jgi:hypothetical protein
VDVEFLLRRLNLRANGSKAERIERAIAHFHANVDNHKHDLSIVAVEEGP